MQEYRNTDTPTIHNTGKAFENTVYQLTKRLVEEGSFLVSQPNAVVEKGKKYYSRDREAYIQTDVSIEKYFSTQDEISPGLIIIIECKDYKDKVTIDDVEEFHAKLQQIGADNTKGILISRDGKYQKSAINYAKAKGITLAKLDLEDGFSLGIGSAVECKLEPCFFLRFIHFILLPVWLILHIGTYLHLIFKSAKKLFLINKFKNILERLLE